MTTAALDTQTRPGPGIRFPRFPSSKFCPPKRASNLVSRARLLDLLDSGGQHRLTLVVGAAGAGKTTLLADWLASRPDRGTAWVNCDEADSDPVRFFASVIDAMHRTNGRRGFGEDARQLLRLEGQVSPDVVAALASDVEAHAGPQVLVVDDFHLTGAEGAAAFGRLLDYRPPTLQLVIATRVDPNLRLHRLRSSGELVELRERDLCFSEEETGLLLAGFDVKLDGGDVAIVHQRSEGWAAGLQMAAISIQVSTDPVKAASQVELHHHTVAGYFLEEVLYRQAPELIDFMLATSVLDELSTPACAALLDRPSAALLEHLYGAHMFVTAVDEKAGTYRYHQLVKEVLQAELHAREPARAEQLHRAAASYLDAHGDVGSAARHLLAAGDPTAAFKLLSERTLAGFSADPRSGSALDFDELNPDLFSGRPEFLVPLAAELLLRGAIDRGERALFLAEQTYVDPVRDPELAMKLTLTRCLYYFGIGDVDLSLAIADEGRKIDVDPDGLGQWLAGFDVVDMYCSTYLGHLSRARQMAKAVLAAPGASDSEKEVLCPSVMSQAAWAEGSVREAEALAARSLSSARRLGLKEHYYIFGALRTTALLALERRDLASASELTEKGLALAGGGRPLFAFMAQLDRARIWAAQGDADDALASLPAAREVLRSHRSPLLAMADEVEARLRLSLGDLRGAGSALDRLPGARHQVVAAIVALAAGDERAASEQLAHLPARGATPREDLELRLLRANGAVLAASPSAPRLMREALAIVEKDGFVQTVLDTAPQLADHLVTSSSNYPAGPILTSLITARLEERKQAAGTLVRETLLDPLTEAEIRVLEKLSQRLTYVDIAADLHLSLNTIKTHLRHSYMKLGVDSRTAALKRAASLGVI